MIINIYNSCLRKKKYSYALALVVTDKIYKRAKFRPRIYKCNFCNKYHLTKQIYKHGFISGSLSLRNKDLRE